MKLEGGCVCGKVRYSADAEPIFVGVCHCTTCQKASGSAFNVVVAVPKSALSVQGMTKTLPGTATAARRPIGNSVPTAPRR